MASVQSWRWAEVRTIWAMEVRSALREGHILVNSVLLPVVLYPFLLWIVISGLTFVRGQEDRTPSRVALLDLPDSARELEGRLQAHESIDLVDAAANDAPSLVRKGELDLAMTALAPNADGASLASNWRMELLWNASRERSETALRRVETVVDDLRFDHLAREATAREVDPAEWAVFDLVVQNDASSKQMGRFVLGLLLPMLFVVMMAVGCFYPAVDATAGERERGTWETLMTVSASRASIVVGKYLYVASFGVLAGTLNLFAMMLSSRALLAPALDAERAAIDFSVPLAAIPLALAGAALLALFVAAGMMILASFARTFKEGQSMITPFYMLVLLPVFFLQVPGLRLTVPLSLVPVVNVTLMLREAISGSYPPIEIALTFLVGGVFIALCLWFAHRLLGFEDVVTGSYGGGLRQLLRERFSGRRAAAAAGEGDGR